MNTKPQAPAKSAPETREDLEGRIDEALEEGFSRERPSGRASARIKRKPKQDA